MLREYELHEKIVCICVETLGNIVKNKKLAIQVANRGAIESLLRVITVQDYNKNLAFKSTNMLYTMTVAVQNIEKILHFNGSQILINLVNV